MIVNTTKAQRDFSTSALKIAEKLAKGTAGNLTRLQLSDALAHQMLGCVEFVRDELAKILPSETDIVAVEVTSAAVAAWRVALMLFVRQATKQSETAAQLTLTTNIGTVEHAALELLNSLNEQMNLPLQTMADLTAGAEDEEVAIEQDRDVQPAPHRGRRSSAGTDPLVEGTPGNHTPQPAEKKKWGRQHHRKAKNPKAEPDVPMAPE